MLRAQQEVEDGLAGFLQSEKRLVILEEAAAAAKRSADLALIQYREGATDYTTVLTAQAALLTEQDSLAAGRGDVPQGLITVYRALGGGWEIREGQRFCRPTSPMPWVAAPTGAGFSTRRPSSRKPKDNS